MRYLRFMEIVAHGLWAAAAAVTANRKTGTSIRIGWAVWWAAFPDVLAFGLPALIGIGLKLTGNLDPASGHSHLIPRVHLPFPLYPAGHSLIVFLAAFGLVSILARRFVLEMLGWLLHILIDIGTHSVSYYATRFLWPVSDFRVDGIAWWTPWFWAATYVALAIVYIALWKKGWLSRSRRPDLGAPETCGQTRY